MIGWQGGPPPRWFGEHSGKSQAPPNPPCSSFWHPLLPHPPVCLQNSTNLKSTFSTLKLGSHATKTAHNITHISEPFSPPPQMKVCGCRNGRESNGIRCCIQCLQCLQCIVYNGGRRHCLLIWEIALWCPTQLPHMAQRCRNEELKHSFPPTNYNSWNFLKSTEGLSFWFDLPMTRPFESKYIAGDDDGRSALTPGNRISFYRQPLMSFWGRSDI